MSKRMRLSEPEAVEPLHPGRPFRHFDGHGRVIYNAISGFLDGKSIKNLNETNMETRRTVTAPPIIPKYIRVTAENIEEIIERLATEPYPQFNDGSVTNGDFTNDVVFEIKVYDRKVNEHFSELLLYVRKLYISYDYNVLWPAPTQTPWTPLTEAWQYVADTFNPPRPHHLKHWRNFEEIYYGNIQLCNNAPWLNGHWYIATVKWPNYG
jgi:hypothetical protein